VEVGDMTDKVLPFRRRGAPLPSERAPTPIPDESLIAACAIGDNQALDELFRRHGARVHRVLGRMRMIDHRDLEDVVQNTFIEVRRSALRFEGRAAVGTWILGIAMNILRHHVRGESRRRAAMKAVASVPPPPSARGPDDQAAQRQALVRLQAGLDALPEVLRIVFTLCDVEGLRGSEVARILDVPEGTVWRRLHEARLRLRDCLAPQVTP
jgi:RNA polymerase sigma-70 factor (ECF subfamily)